jgi:hypothetical protein
VTKGERREKLWCRLCDTKWLQRQIGFGRAKRALSYLAEDLEPDELRRSLGLLAQNDSATGSGSGSGSSRSSGSSGSSGSRRT